MAKVSFIILATLLLVLIQGGSALKCWRCSSDEGVCDDPFNVNSLTVQQRQFRYVDCYLAQEPQQPYVSMKFRPVCKKTIQKVNDRSIVNRTCSWEDVTAKDDACQDEPTLYTVKTKFCQTCFTDGCNGAAAQTISAVLFLGVLTLIVKALNLF